MPISGVFFRHRWAIAACLLLGAVAARAQQQPAPAPAAPPSTPAFATPPPALAEPAPSASSSPAPAAVTGTANVPGTASVTGTTSLTGTSSLTLSGTSASAVSPTPTPSPYRIEIDLEEQRAYLLKNGKTIAQSPISSGRPGHLTPTGDFSVLEKDLNHFSSLYGKIVEKGTGRTVIAGADAAMAVPKGCRFERAPMKYFLRFDGATGMHAGILPGYPASHGCVRMPLAKAELFYKTVQPGVPVHVFGTAPAVRIRQEGSHPRPMPRPSPAPSPVRGPRHGWWLF